MEFDVNKMLTGTPRCVVCGEQIRITSKRNTAEFVIDIRMYCHGEMVEGVLSDEILCEKDGGIHYVIDFLWDLSARFGPRFKLNNPGFGSFPVNEKKPCARVDAPWNF